MSSRQPTLTNLPLGSAAFTKGLYARLKECQKNVNSKMEKHYYNVIGPCPMHDVVVTAVSAAVSAATIILASMSKILFLSISLIEN